MNIKKSITLCLLLLGGLTVWACSQSQSGQKNETNATQAEQPVPSADNKGGEVIQMNRDMFIQQVFDYTGNVQEWTYKGSKPAIIDLYADWCGPCRMIAPILKELAQEYADQIVIYKVNVDKEKELAALFQANSIPLLVFIPMNGQAQLFRGAADKATYKKAIDDFLLKGK